jgi:hypothetical protein
MKRKFYSSIKLNYYKPKIKAKMASINFFKFNMRGGEEVHLLAASGCVCCGDPSVSVSCCLGC